MGEAGYSNKEETLVVHYDLKSHWPFVLMNMHSLVLSDRSFEELQVLQLQPSSQ